MKKFYFILFLLISFSCTITYAQKGINRDPDRGTQQPAREPERRPAVEPVRTPERTSPPVQEPVRAPERTNPPVQEPVRTPERPVIKEPEHSPERYNPPAQQPERRPDIWQYETPSDNSSPVQEIKTPQKQNEPAQEITPQRIITPVQQIKAPARPKPAAQPVRLPDKQHLTVLNDKNKEILIEPVRIPAHDRIPKETREPRPAAPEEKPLPPRTEYTTPPDEYIPDYIYIPAPCIEIPDILIEPIYDPEPPEAPPITMLPSEALKMKGIDFFEEGKYDEAFLIFSQGIILYPADSEFIFYRGCTHVLLGNYEDAIEDLNIYMGDSCANGEAFYFRGVAKYYLKEKDEALTDLEYSSDLGNLKAQIFLRRFF